MHFFNYGNTSKYTQSSNIKMRKIDTLKTSGTVSITNKLNLTISLVIITRLSESMKLNTNLFMTKEKYGYFSVHNKIILFYATN